MIPSKANKNDLSIEKIRDFVKWWNSVYPIDYWWRQKYKVPFGSQAHQDQNVLDMRIEFEEDLLVIEQSLINLKKDRYILGHGDWLNKKVDTNIISEAEGADFFDDLNIAELQKQDMSRQERGETEEKNIEIKRR